MGKFEDHVERYASHIAVPWQTTIAGAQRVIMVVYDKEQERLYRARKAHFEEATVRSGHTWLEVDIATAFGQWMAGDIYRDEYFREPELLQPKLEDEFPVYVADRIRTVLCAPEADSNSVVALFGVGALYGLTRVTSVVKHLERDIVGRLAVFFPGTYSDNNYRLLDARDGWNYLAVPVL